MPRGLTRTQIGVTEEMIQSFGNIVLELSHNFQIRRGDPIRELDYDQIEVQRADLGLTDSQIAARIGLTRNQVLYIRTVSERRRFRGGHYNRLLALGGGKRFRAERFKSDEEHPAVSEQAMALRAAMRFDPTLARRYVAQGWWGADTLTSWLQRWARETPDAIAIQTRGSEISYAELADRVDRLMSGLARIGVRGGDVVALQLPNTPEFLVAYLAICGLGAVMSPIHMSYRGAEIESLLVHNEARAVICLGEFKDGEPVTGMLELKRKIDSLQAVVVVGRDADGAVSFSELCASELGGAAIDPPVASDPFLLLYTSGTTAAPKGVPLSYHNMLSNARLSVPEHGLSAKDVVLCAAPVTHLFGLYSFHLALCTGARSLLLPSFTPPGLAEIIEAGQATALFAGPAHIAACLNAGLFDQRDLSSLKLAVISGSPLAAATAKALDANLKNGRVTQLWGMTETQAGLYTRPGDPIEVASRSAGRPSPGTEARIVAEDGEAVPAGTEGELQVRGCLLFPGYFKNEEATKAAFAEGGWFRTGDLALADEAGNISITGRLKDIINRGGVKYNPVDIEAIISGMPEVQACAIVAMKDDVLGERACAFVQLAGGGAITLEDVTKHLDAKSVSKGRWPERLEIVDAMPLTPTQKIIKSRLKPRA